MFLWKRYHKYGCTCVLLQNAEASAGWLGLSLVISGMFGSVLCGVVLDKTHRYKETTLVVYLLSLGGMLAYTFVLSAGPLWPTFIVTCGLG